MESKTVKVRIAVAVDPEGAWHCCGWDGCDEQEAFSYCIDSLGSGESRYILTAELAIPEVVEVPAAIEKVEGNDGK